MTLPNPRFQTPAVDDASTLSANTAWMMGQAGTADPLMDGVASAGNSKRWSPINHRHPTDTSLHSKSVADVPSPLGLGASILPRLVKDNFDDFVSFKRFRRASDANDGVTIAYALTLHPAIYIPPGDYLSSVPLVPSIAGQSLIGAGWGATRIRQSTTNQALISLPDYADHVTIAGMTLGRSVGAVAGGSGIVCQGRASYVVLRDLSVEDHFRNIHLSSTDWGVLENVVSRRAYEDGLTIVPYQDVNGGACQWQLGNVLSQLNAGNGIRVQGVTGTNGIILGAWNRISTFANSSNGILLAGLSGTGTAGCSINDFRLTDFFLGSDGVSGLQVDVIGGINNRVYCGTVELAGEDFTGRTYTTAKSHTGYGVLITNSTKHFQMGQMHVSDCSYTGIAAAQFGILQLTDVAAEDCGVAGTAGATFGIHNSGTGKLSGVNIRAGNNYRSSQTVGVVGADGAKVKLTGGDLTGNIAARTYYGTNSGSAVETNLF